jgi:hypothetical protein
LPAPVDALVRAGVADAGARRQGRREGDQRRRLYDVRAFTRTLAEVLPADLTRRTTDGTIVPSIALGVQEPV